MKMLFNKGGIPTKPQVDALIEKLQTYETMDVMPYEVIESLMECTRKSERGAGIVAAFKRRAFKDLNILLVSVAKVGYQLCDATSRLNYSSRQSEFGRRRICKAAVVAGSTNDKNLTDQEKALKQHLSTLPGRLHLMELCQPKT